MSGIEVIGGSGIFRSTAQKYSLSGEWDPDSVSLCVSFGEGVIVIFNQKGEKDMICNCHRTMKKKVQIR